MTMIRSAVAMLTVVVLTGCISVDLFSGGGQAPLTESVVRGKTGPKILLLEIDGVITGADEDPSLLGFGSRSMVTRVREILDRAVEQDDVKAILLRIDSPGGSATASEQVYTEIRRFAQARQAPVVAQMLSTAASGGYYVAMSADTIQAHPTTVTGSIGVIFTSVNFVGLMEKLGVEDQTITGGEFKDAGSPFRRLTSEERAQLQAIVDDLHARFREIVERGRPALTRERVATLADGRIYSARQALEHGLVDRVGTLEEAVGLIEDRLGVSASRVVAYHRPSAPRRNLYARALPGLPMGLGGPALPLQAAGIDRFATDALGRLLARPGFHYLWWPGLSALGGGRY